MVARIGLLTGLALLAASPSLAQTDPAEDAYQNAQYLQWTRGDLGPALESYKTLGATKGVRSEAALLRQVECLGWAGRSDEGHKAVAALMSPDDPALARLGQVRFFPAESDLILHLDLRALGLSRALDALRFKWVGTPGDEQEPASVLHNPFDELGLDGHDLHRISLGLSLAKDDSAAVGHWVARIEGRLGNLREDVVERLVRWLACQVSAGAMDASGLMLDQTDQGLLVMELDKACCDRKGLKIESSRSTLHGRSVLWVSVEGPRIPASGFSLGLVRVDSDTILLGERRSLTWTLAAMAGERVGLRASSRLWSLARQLPDELAQPGLWIALVPDEIMLQAQRVLAVLGWGEAPPGMWGIIISGRLQGELLLEAKAWAADEKSALTVADLARGGLAILRMTTASSASQDPQIKRIVDSLKVDLSGRRISATARIPKSMIQPAPAR
jgi:hypothetical protein